MMCQLGRDNTIHRGEKNQIKGGGAMVLTRKDVMMRKVEKGENMAELLKVQLVMKNGRKRDLVVVYVPLKTNAWGREEYGDILKDMQLCLKGRRWLSG